MPTYMPGPKNNSPEIAQQPQGLEGALCGTGKVSMMEEAEITVPFDPESYNSLQFDHVKAISTAPSGNERKFAGQDAGAAQETTFFASAHGSGAKMESRAPQDLGAFTWDALLNETQYSEKAAEPVVVETLQKEVCSISTVPGNEIVLAA